MSYQKITNKHTIGTSTGGVFDYDNPRMEDIHIEDIAHSLSNICRFGGHTNVFYSVAQHSLLVSRVFPGSPEDKLAALLHDAAEAYCGDLPSPLKNFLSDQREDGYSRLLREVEWLCFSRFGMDYTDFAYSHPMWKYDKAACVLEAQAFFGWKDEELQDRGFDPSLVGLWKPWDPIKYHSARIVEEPYEVEADFLWEFEALTKMVGRPD